MTDFQIQSGVSIPNNRDKGVYYPFEKLNVGEMFHVPLLNDTPDGKYKLRFKLTNYRRKHSYKLERKKFTIARLELKGKPGFGVWRIE